MGHKRRVRVAGVLLLLCMGAAASVASGQAPLGESVAFDISPAIPGPQESVSVRAASYSFDINRAFLVWSLNGVELARGQGATDVSFTTGEPGSTARLHVDITAPSGATISRDFVFTVGDLAVIIESDTYTPPFYRGRALPARGALTRFIAVPSIPGFGVNDFVYKWEREYEPIPDNVGVRQNVFSVKASDIHEAVTVSVEATSLDGSVRLRKDVVLEGRAPQVVFYEDNALRGVIYEQAIPQAASLRGKEVTFIAEPYFFSVKNRTDARLTYAWLLDGSEPEVAPSPSLTLRQDVEGEGSAYIELSIQNGREIFQSAGAAFSLLFGQTQ